MDAGPCFELLNADESLLVVDKPPGLLAVPGRGEVGVDNLAARVQRRFADAMVVHRLDMATSGLMLFARGAAMQRALSMAFERGAVDKRYVAVVEGAVDGEEGLIEAPLAADWPRRPRQQVDPVRGKPSATRWRVIARAPGATRLLLQPLTGRTHQLRVHLQWLGHPIRGDVLYAPAPPGAGRMLLHATRLEFVHPRSGERCRFESVAPF